MTINKYILKKCLKEIEHKLSWSESFYWQQKQFEKLSEVILEKTKIRISPVTLKRIWGKVNYTSDPSISTLDALALFLGYNDWMDYTHHVQTKKTFKLRQRFFKNPKVILTTSLSLLIILGVIVIFYLKELNVNDYSSHQFSIIKSASDLPYTIKFKYDVQSSDAKTAMIQQSWDSRFRYVVDKEKTDFSCIYYFPGYFKPKLIIDDSIVAEQALLIKTKGLQGIIHKKPIPSYISTEQLKCAGGLEITEAHLLKEGFDLKNYIPTTTINLVGGLEDIKGNNFSIEADLMHTYPKGDAICQKCEVIVMCTNGNFRVPISIKDCVSNLKVVMPDKTISSKDVDLSPLGTDFSGFVHVKVTVQGGHFKACVNNNHPFTDTLTVNPGNVIGIKFRFHGTGKVKSFQLNSGDASYAMTDFLP